MHEPTITVTGHVGAPPRMRVLASGAVVTDFRLASTPRSPDKNGVWSDGETLWLTVTCWKALAENVAASLHKGDKVTVSGRLKVSTWKTEQGELRSGLEVITPTVGFDLSRGTAVLEKNPPLTLTSDPGPLVDIHTGEVLDEPFDDVEPAEHDELDEDALSLGERVGAGV